MNKQSIDLARDADMRSTMAAIKRSAQRARELAIQTGTRLVISRGGVIQTLAPEQVGEDATVIQTLDLQPVLKKSAL